MDFENLWRQHTRASDHVGGHSYLGPYPYDYPGFASEYDTKRSP